MPTPTTAEIQREYDATISKLTELRRELHKTGSGTVLRSTRASIETCTAKLNTLHWVLTGEHSI